ncbi:MAG TPA: TonB-dependent receptor [Caulobacteraceae bacterium]|nr:TonB-dependent receptor [Caulobacteraceae bacterium]
MRNIKLHAVLMCSSMLAIPAFASAQSAPATPTSEVVVTGSRVITNGNNSPTPLTVVQAADVLKLQPTTLVAAIGELPAFSGMKGAESGSQPGPPNGGNGAATLLNLRNLQPQRTLILLDGQRFPPTLFTGGVDVDAIPEMMIQRVDVVTGGASAVYGSDAVSGVVNFVTDNKFNGVKMQAQYGESTYSDDPSYKIGIAAGRSFLDGKLHLEGSYQHYDDKGLTSRLDRASLDNYAFGGAGSAASPLTVFQNVRQNNVSFGGLISAPGSALNGYTFDTNGVATPFVHGASIHGTGGGASDEIGGDGAFGNAGIKSPLRSNQVFLRADYDLTDTVHAFVQAMYNEKYNLQYYGWTRLNNEVLSTSNPYLTAAQQAALASAGATFKLSKILSDVPMMGNNADEQQFFINAGLDGKLLNYDWGLDVNYARTALMDTINNNPNNQNIALALDTTTNSSGQIVCRSALVNPTLYGNCVPLNPFGPTSDAAAINYITGTTHLNVHTSFVDAVGHVDGEAFQDWAGPVRISVSGELRQNTLDYDTDYPYNVYVNCPTGTPNCPSTSSLYGQVYGDRTPVTQAVEEAAFETNVPLLKDLPFAKSLDLNGAVRFTNYSTSGSYWTWKIGLDWKVADGVTLRATNSRDIQAPTLYDLEQAISIVPANGTDYYTGNTSDPYNTVNKGNPTLTAEKGFTRTAGVVFQPDKIPGFSLAVDGYYIKIDDAIQQVRGWDQSVQQACINSGGSSPYCALEARPLGFTTTSAATNSATAFYAEYINIASVTTYGLDIEGNYRTRILDRPASFRLLASWQPHLYVNQPGVPEYDCGDAADCAANYQASSSLRITGQAHMDVTEAFALDLQERWRGSEAQSGEMDGPYTPAGSNVYASRLGALGYTDVTLTYKVNYGPLRPEVFFNVQNLFNALPSPTAGSGNIGSGGPGSGWANAFDDPVGRYYTVGLRAKF